MREREGARSDVEERKKKKKKTCFFSLFLPLGTRLPPPPFPLLSRIPSFFLFSCFLFSIKWRRTRPQPQRRLLQLSLRLPTR